MVSHFDYARRSSFINMLIMKKTRIISLLIILFAVGALYLIVLQLM